MEQRMDQPSPDEGRPAPVPLEEWLMGSVDALVDHIQPALRQFLRERVSQSLAEAIRSLADNVQNIVQESPAWQPPTLPPSDAAGLSVSEASSFDETSAPDGAAESRLAPESVEQELPAPEAACYDLRRQTETEEVPEPQDGAPEVAAPPLEPEPVAAEPPGAQEPEAAPRRATRLAQADSPTQRIRKRKQTQVEIDSNDQRRGHHEPVSQLTGHLFAEAEEHRRKGERALALARYKEVIKLDPLFVPGYRERGQLLRLVGELDQAFDDLHRACELDPTDAECFLRRGNVLADQGKLDEAIADYSYAIARDPQKAVYYLNRGLARAKKQAFAEVIADGDQAIALDPELAQAYFIRGFALHRRCRYDEALADFNRLLELNPKNALAYNERGLVHVSKGQYAEAVRDYVQALKLCPKLLLARYNRGIAYRLKGDYELAIADFSEILRRKPDNHQASLNRGLCHFARGDFDRALPDIAQAHELAPDNTEIAGRLEEVRAALKQHNQQLNRKRGFSLAGREETGPAHFITVTCPECGVSGGINWGKLDFLFQCKGCKNVFRVDPLGQLLKVREPHKLMPKAAPAPAPARKPEPARARRSSSPEIHLHFPAIPWKHLAVAAVILILLSPVYLLFAMRKEPVKKWQRFNVVELCNTFDNEPSKLQTFENVEIEVSGLVHSSEQDSSDPTLWLGTRDSDERVICQIDPNALSTKRLLPTAQTGKYVIVKGTIKSIGHHTVKLEGARISLVFDKSPERGLTVGDLSTE